MKCIADIMAGAAAGVLERNATLNRLARQYASGAPPDRWAAIRAAYALQMPQIVEARSKGGRSDPNFFDWHMTPIERWAWIDIRHLGLPLYPQVPVEGCFIDFADPWLRIGVELDGAQFHSWAEDRRRDEFLWQRGWRIFRIRGTEAFPRQKDAMPDSLATSTDQPLDEDASRWIQEAGEGVLWAIREAYYRPGAKDPRTWFAVYWSLRAHSYADFPIEIEQAEAH